MTDLEVEIWLLQATGNRLKAMLTRGSKVEATGISPVYARVGEGTFLSFVGPVNSASSSLSQ